MTEQGGELSRHVKTSCAALALACLARSAPLDCPGAAERRGKEPRDGMLSGRRILLIIGGGIAAYKSLELIRLLKKAGAGVVPVLTAGGAEFVTPAHRLRPRRRAGPRARSST